MPEVVPDLAAKLKPKFRGVSHLVAFFFAIIGAGVVIALAPTPEASQAGLIYVATLVAMFGVSALYHRPMWSIAARRRMRRLDHATIYLLIAGTYTPVCLLGLRDQTVLLTVVWVGAALGVLHAVFFAHLFRSLNALLYVVLGCTVLPAMPGAVGVLGTFRTTLLILGGAVYITGALIYTRRRPNPMPAVFGYHEVFHLMVILAAALHYVAVLDLVRFS